MSKTAKETAEIYKDAYVNGPPGAIAQLIDGLLDFRSEETKSEEEGIRQQAYIDRIRDGKE